MTYTFSMTSLSRGGPIDFELSNLGSGKEAVKVKAW